MNHRTCASIVLVAALSVATAALHAQSTSAPLLTNGSFEQQGDGPDQAAGWSRWGDWINREDGWSPTHSGKCLIGYHHWQITKADSSGLWQDVKVEPGKRYTFSVYATHDTADKPAHDADTVELRLEAVGTGDPVLITTENFPVAKLDTGKSWGKLSITGKATTGTLRVLLVINPSADANRGGAVKLDDAALKVTN